METPDHSWEHPLDLERSAYKSELLVDDTDCTLPKYEAVSYSWGDPGQEEEILVKVGVQSPKTFRVRPSLAECLRHLRRAESRILWIDAICINQNDTRERGSQVSRMGDIYRRAERVVAWLGPASQDSKLALKTLEYFARQVVITKGGWHFPAPEATEWNWYGWEATLPYDAATWNAIYSFFDRSWFSRLWIIQEIMLANKRAIVQCGFSEILWASLSRAIRTLSRHVLPSSALQARLEVVERAICLATTGYLPDLLQRTRGQKCSDRRDRVYALLSLAEHDFLRAITPDYNLRPEEVYQQVCVAMIKETGSLHCLDLCDISRWRGESPSWVADFSVNAATQDFTLMHSASGEFKSSSKFLDGRTLSVAGLLMAKVHSVCQEAFAEANILAMLKTWERHVLEREEVMTCQPTLHDFVETVCASGTKESYGSSDYPTLHESVEAYTRYSNEAVLLDNESAAKIRGLKHAMRCSPGRALITFQDGSIGLGLPSAQPGDTVAVVLGYPAPILLQKSLSGTYNVVGACYVRGLSSSQGLLGPLPSGYSCTYLMSHGGVWSVQYRHDETDTYTKNDPRLGEPPSPWKLEVQIEGATPEYPWFINVETGKRTEFDPRLTPEALEERGVPIHDIHLV